MTRDEFENRPKSRPVLEVPSPNDLIKYISSNYRVTPRGVMQSRSMLDEFERVLAYGYILWNELESIERHEIADVIRTLPLCFYYYHLFIAEHAEFYTRLRSEIQRHLGLVKLTTMFEPFSSYGPYSILHLDYSLDHVAVLQDYDPICGHIQDYCRPMGARATVKNEKIVPERPIAGDFDLTIVGADSMRFFSLDDATQYLSRLETNVLVLALSDDPFREGGKEFYYPYRGVVPTWTRNGNGSDGRQTMELKYDGNLLLSADLFGWDRGALFHNIERRYRLVARIDDHYIMHAA